MNQRLAVMWWILGFSLCTGCFQVPAEPAPPPTSISSFGPLGSFTMTSGANCAGHATLVGGIATVNDSCFTGADNVVLCTDTTTPAAVKCVAASGSLNLAGASGDTIAYARIR
jgi:hypothetical protein